MTDPPELQRTSESRFSRRAVLGTGLAVATGITAVGYAGTKYLQDGPTTGSETYPDPVYGNPDREFQLTSAIGEIEVGPNETVETWDYDDQYPGPELRAEEGERVRITVQNDLPEETSVHWHGMALPDANAMDGVPGVTQPPIEPGVLSKLFPLAKSISNVLYCSEMYGTLQLNHFG